MPEGLVIGGGGSNENPSTISGDGSEYSPYIVNSYADLTEALRLIRLKETTGTYYAKMMSDIDGEWEEWTRIASSNADGKFMDLDFNGHAIKNFMLPSFGMFTLADGDIFRNGYIYNTYAEELTGPVIENIETINMVVSSYIKTCTYRPFYNVKLDHCAYWCTVEDFNTEMSRLQAMVVFKADDPLVPDSAYLCEESDFYFHIKNCNLTNFWLLKCGGTFATPRYTRIQGSIDNITPDTIVEYPYISDSNIGLIESVINFEMPAYSGTVSSGTATTIIGTGTTGVINTELIHEQTYAEYTMLNLLEVTDDQMHDADWLTANGFEVYKVGD